MQPFSAKFSSKCWIHHVAHLRWTYYKFFIPWQQSPSVAGSSEVRFSVSSFICVCFPHTIDLHLGSTTWCSLHCLVVFVSTVSL